MDRTLYDVDVDVLKKITFKILRGNSYDFDPKNHMFWKLVNSFKMMK